MVEQNIYPTSELYVNMLDHLSRGGHFELLPKVWEKIDDIEHMADDIRPLIQKCVTRGDYESAISLIQCSTKRTSNKKDSYHYYIEMKLFNMLRYSEKVCDDWENTCMGSSILFVFLQHTAYDFSKIKSCKTYILEGQNLYFIRASIEKIANFQK